MCRSFSIAVAGLAEVAAWLPLPRAHSVIPASALAVVALAVSLAGAARAWPAANQSENRFAASFAREIIRTLPDSALVLQGNWDIQSPGIYLQTIERFRPDVVMLDLALMQRPWYLRQAMRAHPEVFAGSEAAVQTFIREVAPFEAGRPYDGRRIENAFIVMHHAIIDRQLTAPPRLPARRAANRDIPG